MDVYGGGFMFDVIPVIVVLGFIFVFGTIIVSGIRGISEWSDNNKQDIVTYKALAVAKRQHVTHSHTPATEHTPAHDTTSNDYYVTFQDEYGARQEFRVKDREYGLIAEGDRGLVSHQGTRYKGFEREGSDSL